MSDTPLTDAAYTTDFSYGVSVKFARDLERQNAALLALVTRAQEILDGRKDIHWASECWLLNDLEQLFDEYREGAK